MNKGFVISSRALALVTMVAALVPRPVAGQTSTVSAAAAQTNGNLPRTSDGKPDLQGVFFYGTLTPMQRPHELAEKAFFTNDEEVAAYEKHLRETDPQVSESARPKNVCASCPEKDDGVTDPDIVFAGGNSFNVFWQDKGTHIVRDWRTSLVSNPPDGKIPPMTPEAKKVAADRIARRRGQASAEDLGVAIRCLFRPEAGGPPMVPFPYNSYVQIFQTPGQVVIYNEMIHRARIVPLDGRPHLPQSIRDYSGDSIGHWEGETLVVDTTNFKDENVAGADRNLHLTERFTPIDAATIHYEFTVDDPTAFTKSWSVSNYLTKTDDKVYEYACHEGSDVAVILNGARIVEKKLAEEAAKKNEQK
jgi:hypothetical protein